MKILIVDDDVVVADVLADLLSAATRTVVVCHDSALAELILDHEHISVVICDIRLTGQFRFEGLDFIDYVKARTPHCTIIIISGNVTTEIEAEALRRGAATVLQKPFEMAALESFIADGAPGDGSGEVIRPPSLDAIISGDCPIVPSFQPIVKLDGVPSAFAFEALCRIASNSLLARPDLLFDYASRLKRVVDLELAAIARSLETGSVLAHGALLFLNLHPAALDQGERLAATVINAAGTCGLPLDRVVLELTEQQPIRHDASLERTVAALRDRGVRFAFDDVGSAYSHLSLIDLVRPEFLKVSQHFGTDFELDPTRSKLVRNLHSLAADFGSELIVEGIESAATASAARDLGIRLGQGYYFARPSRPADLGAWVRAGAASGHEG